MVVTATPTDLKAVHVAFRCTWQYEELQELQRETLDDLLRKSSSPSGNLVIAPESTRVVSLENLLLQLEDQGFELVAGWMQETLPPLSERYGSTNFVINFHFVPREQAEVSEKVSEVLRRIFTELTSMNYWHCQAYRNPSDNGSWLSINLNARVQRYLGDDPEKPVMVRNRDEQGQKIEGSHPITADAELVLEDLVPVLR